MTNSIETTGEASVYECQFESIDASNAADFKRELQNRLSSSKKVVLDLRNVQFVDGAGLGAMVWMVFRCTSGAELTSLCPGPGPPPKW